VAFLLASAGGPDFVTRRNKFGLTAADLVTCHSFAAVPMRRVGVGSGLSSLQHALAGSAQWLQLRDTANPQAVLQAIVDGQREWEVRHSPSKVHQISVPNSIPSAREGLHRSLAHCALLQERRAELIARFCMFLHSPAVRSLPTELRSLIWKHLVPYRSSCVPAPEQTQCASTFWTDLGSVSDTESEGLDGTVSDSASDSDSESVSHAG
jgi:hypothetical protein